MHLLIAAILVLLVAVTYKYLINAVYASRIRTFRSEHNEYIKKLLAKDKSAWEFVKKCPAIKEMMKKANIGDQKLSWMEPVGYGHIQQQQASILDNISTDNKEIQSRVYQAFHEAEGVFESRKNEALDPFYWTELIIYLPSRILSYLGIPKESIWGRFANILGWILEVVGFFTSLPDFTGFQQCVSRIFASLFGIEK
jgi:hypothetical protein